MGYTTRKFKVLNLMQALSSVYAAKALDNENTACRLTDQASTSLQSPSPCSAMVYAADAHTHAGGGSLSRDRGINAVAAHNALYHT